MRKSEGERVACMRKHKLQSVDLGSVSQSACVIIILMFEIVLFLKGIFFFVRTKVVIEI